jgi:cytochrome P450
MTARSTFRYEDIPAEMDRTEGCRFVRSFGDVFESEDGTWVLASAEAVEFAHRNPGLFSSDGVFASGLQVPAVPVGVDPPAHVKYRRILDPMFSPRIINGLEDELRAQVRELVLAFAPKGRCDAIADLARLYPTQVFLTMLGLPLADRDHLVELVETQVEHSTTGLTEPSPTARKAMTDLFSYMAHYIDVKRQQPGDDVLARVLALEGEDAWSTEEVLGMCVIFTMAGLDTVTGAIGFLLYHLARNPGLRRRVVADPSLVGPVIEEVLRLETPSPHQPRITTQDVEVCGVTIPAGSKAIIFTATANRDPARYAHADELDVDDDVQGHTTFGGGIHRCLGSHLARRELKLVIEEFHRLIPEYDIEPGFEPEVVFPSATWHLRSLPLVFAPVGTERTLSRRP